jgi:TonB family protein
MTGSSAMRPFVVVAALVMAAGCGKAEVDLSEAKASSSPAPAVAVSSLPPEQQRPIYEVVNDQRDVVSSCFTLHDVGQDQRTAEVKLELLIAEDGTVGSGKVLSANPNSEAANKCIVERAGKWRFPSGQRPRTFVHTFKLTKSTASATSNSPGDQMEVMRVVMMNRRTVRNCYEKNASAEQKAGKSEVKVRIVIGQDGSVKSATVKEASVKNPALENCLVTGAKRWRFKPSINERVVIYPFTFQ